MSLQLEKNPKWNKRKGPLVLCILDGVGYSKYPEGDAVAQANMPCFRELENLGPQTRLKAHGTAVGLPDDGDMGNSEVGHNAIGAGRVFDQGAKLVQKALADGSLYEGKVWRKAVEQLKGKPNTLHFLSLLSDGNVHSHWEHLKAMLGQAKKEGLSRVRLHILTDGRDVDEFSALEYVEPLEEYLASLNDASFDCQIASGGGRMKITMDRYEADWGMVKLGWETHVLGKGRQFASAAEAISTLREETGKSDQDLEPFVIAKEGVGIGTVEDGDAFFLTNFRGDRAIEISRAFEEKDFTPFDRQRFPAVFYAGMMEYDGDLHIPSNFLVAPPEISRTMGEYLSDNAVRQFAISETQKYGHVTYFFNGNRSGKFSDELEVYKEVPSDRVTFNEKPEMQVEKITDATVAAIESGDFDFIRLNYANGDMVGHTGDLKATIHALETVDKGLSRLKAAVEKSGGVLVVTADHGNADEMYEIDKKTKQVNKAKAKTSHTLNPVPCIIYDPSFQGEYSSELREGLGISSLTACCLELLGFIPPSDYDTSVLQMKN